VKGFPYEKQGNQFVQKLAHFSAKMNRHQLKTLRSRKTTPLEKSYQQLPTKRDLSQTLKPKLFENQTLSEAKKKED